MDQSIQLEPSQVAGFVQSFRSVIPEAVVGATAGARFEMFGLSVEQKFDTGTYLGVSAGILNSELDQNLGAFDIIDTEPSAVPSYLRNHLDYHEPSVAVSVNQLLGQEWSLGARYRISKATLRSRFPEVTDAITLTNFTPRTRIEGILHEATLFGLFNHHSGMFAKGEAVWHQQSNAGYSSDLPGDNFWQFNAFAGYRFPRRSAEVLVGILNIGDQNYHLNPLNVHGEPPRRRTLAVRFQVDF